MRYCPSCGRFNPGRPLICHYCGKSWYYRLCPKGHLNPPDAIFCGECGSSQLTDASGRKSLLPDLIKTAVVMGIVIMIGLSVYQVFHSEFIFQRLMGAVLSFAIPLFILYLFLPSSVWKVIKGGFGLLWGIVIGLLSFLLYEEKK